MKQWKIQRDHTYELLAPGGKIALKVLEAGLGLCSVKSAKESGYRYVEIDNETVLIYKKQPGHGVWLSKLARQLKGEVAVKTIDKYLDRLLDQRILGPPMRTLDPFVHQIMERIEEEGKTKWVRNYYVSNEHLLDLLSIYRATHSFMKHG